MTTALLGRPFQHRPVRVGDEKLKQRVPYGLRFIKLQGVDQIRLQLFHVVASRYLIVGLDKKCREHIFIVVAFAVAQRFFGPFAFRDILDDGGDPDDGAVVALEREIARQEIALSAGASGRRALDLDVGDRDSGRDDLPVQRFGLAGDLWGSSVEFANGNTLSWTLNPISNTFILLQKFNHIFVCFKYRFDYKPILHSTIF